MIMNRKKLITLVNRKIYCELMMQKICLCCNNCILEFGGKSHWMYCLALYTTQYKLLDSPQVLGAIKKRHQKMSFFCALLKCFRTLTMLISEEINTVR